MKRTTLIAATFGGLTALGSTVAFAQDATNFVDGDNNGSWSLTEIQTTNPEVTSEQFTGIDTDANGEASADEISAAIASGALVVVATPNTDGTDGGALVDADNDGENATDLADDDASDDGNTTDATDNEAADGAGPGTDGEQGTESTGGTEGTEGGATN